MRNDNAALRAALVVSDIVVTGIVFIGAGVLRFGELWVEWWREELPNPTLGLVILLLLVVGALWAAGLYRLDARWTWLGESRAVLRGVGLLTLLIVALLFAFNLDDVSRGFLSFFIVLEVLGLLGSRAALTRLFALLRQRSGVRRRVLVVGWSEAAEDMVDSLRADADLGVEVIGCLTPDDVQPIEVSRLGGVDDLGEVLGAHVVDEVLLLASAVRWEDLGGLIAICEEQGKPVRFPLRSMGHAMAHGQVEYYNGQPILSLAPTPDRAAALMAKRLIDVVGALVLLVVALPILVVVAGVSLVVQGRPVTFAQRRVGRHGREFTLHKLRTMVVDAEAQKLGLAALNERDGPAFKVADDPRITPWGRILRRTSLDELPQLWDVVRGAMSLIGPRPPVPEEVKEYDPWHRRRLSMKPGITGLWQVTARRDPDFDRWVEIDIEYIDRWSLWLDLVIALRSIPAVLSLSGR